jgi:site-specific DNA recombinase
MKRMLSDIDNGLIDTVFFKGISRFARDSGETITTAKRLNNKGVRVISLEENYDSFRDEPTMFQIYAVMAEQESRKTSIRVSLGNKQKARRGLWSGANCPYGYIKVKDIPNEEVKFKLLQQGRHLQSLHIDEEKFHIVKKIFEMYTMENLGRKKIVNWLNTNGYKTLKGNVFNEKYITDIISNEVYIGNIVYGKTRYEYIEDELLQKKVQKTIKIGEDDWVRTENAHPPIISKELFIKTQMKINEKSGSSKGRRFNAAKHPLTGILKCGKCNAPMICQKRSNKRKDGTKIEYRYYVCSTYHTKGRHICDQANVNADDLELVVRDTLLNIVSKSLTETKDKLVNKFEIASNQEDNIKGEIKNIDTLLQKKMTATRTLLENRAIYDEETFREISQELQNEVKSLRERKLQLEGQLETSDEEMTIEELEKFEHDFKNFDQLDLSENRGKFHRAIQQIIFKDNQIDKLWVKFKESV